MNMEKKTIIVLLSGVALMLYSVIRMYDPGVPDLQKLGDSGIMFPLVAGGGVLCMGVGMLYQSVGSKERKSTPRIPVLGGRYSLGIEDGVAFSIAFAASPSVSPFVTSIVETLFKLGEAEMFVGRLFIFPVITIMLLYLVMRVLILIIENFVGSKVEKLGRSAPKS
jgi:hypothetical protein